MKVIASYALYCVEIFLCHIYAFYGRTSIIQKWSRPKTESASRKTLIPSLSFFPLSNIAFLQFSGQVCLAGPHTCSRPGHVAYIDPLSVFCPDWAYHHSRRRWCISLCACCTLDRTVVAPPNSTYTVINMNWHTFLEACSSFTKGIFLDQPLYYIKFEHPPRKGWAVFETLAKKSKIKINSQSVPNYVLQHI